MGSLWHFLFSLFSLPRLFINAFEEHWWFKTVKILTLKLRELNLALLACPLKRHLDVSSLVTSPPNGLGPVSLENLWAINQLNPSTCLHKTVNRNSRSLALRSVFTEKQNIPAAACGTSKPGPWWSSRGGRGPAVNSNQRQWWPCRGAAESDGTRQSGPPSPSPGLAGGKTGKLSSQDIWSHKQQERPPRCDGSIRICTTVPLA